MQTVLHMVTFIQHQKKRVKIKKLPKKMRKKYPKNKWINQNTIYFWRRGAARNPRRKKKTVTKCLLMYDICASTKYIKTYIHFKQPSIYPSFIHISHELYLYLFMNMRVFFPYIFSTFILFCSSSYLARCIKIRSTSICIL